jgi:hypothetical protein
MRNAAQRDIHHNHGDNVHNVHYILLDLLVGALLALGR